MDRDAIFTEAHKAANAIAKNETQKGNLADKLLSVMADAIEANVAIDTVWRVIAERGGYADKAHKLDGVKMPGTLATYRSAHRKGEELKVNFRTSWPEFKKSLKPVQSIEQEPEAEQAEAEATGGNEALLENVLIPRWVAEIMNRHARMKVANPAYAAKFEADLVHFVQSWDGGK